MTQANHDRQRDPFGRRLKNPGVVSPNATPGGDGRLVHVSNAMQPSPADRGHLPHLDGLRAVLAIFVVMAHCYATIWTPLYGRAPTGRTAELTHWLTFGNLAVQVFIVLSGYCLMLPVARNGGRLRGFASTFYKRRARRILPTFYAALVLNLLLIWGPLGKPTGAHWDICLPVTPGAVAANILMVQDLFSLYKINHAFWSIGIEWRLYFFFPVLVWAFRKAGPGVTATVCLAGSLLLASELLSSGALWGLVKTVSFFGLFVLGMLAGSRPVWTGGAARSVAVAATLLVIWQQGGWWCPPPMMWEPVREAGTGIVAAAWLAVWSSAGPSATRRILQIRPLPGIGVAAYSLYLIHAPVVQLCWQWIVAPIGLTGLRALTLLLATGVPISIVTAYLFFLAAERPFLSRRQREGAAVEMGPDLSGIGLASASFDGIKPTV